MNRRRRAARAQAQVVDLAPVRIALAGSALLLGTALLLNLA